MSSMGPEGAAVWSVSSQAIGSPVFPEPPLVPPEQPVSASAAIADPAAIVRPQRREVE